MQSWGPGKGRRVAEEGGTGPWGGRGSSCSGRRPEGDAVMCSAVGRQGAVPGGATGTSPALSALPAQTPPAARQGYGGTHRSATDLTSVGLTPEAAPQSARDVSARARKAGAALRSEVQSQDRLGESWGQQGMVETRLSSLARGLTPYLASGTYG